MIGELKPVSKQHDMEAAKVQLISSDRTKFISKLVWRENFQTFRISFFFLNFENLIVEFHIFYILNMHIKFHSN